MRQSMSPFYLFLSVIKEIEMDIKKRRKERKKTNYMSVKSPPKCADCIEKPVDSPHTVPETSNTLLVSKLLLNAMGEFGTRPREGLASTRGLNAPLAHNRAGSIVK